MEETRVVYVPKWAYNKAKKAGTLDENDLYSQDPELGTVKLIPIGKIENEYQLAPFLAR